MIEQMKENAINWGLKHLAPGVIDNIFRSFEALIDETGSNNDLSPYFLHVEIVREDKEVLANVYWEDIILATHSLIEMIEETFNQSMKNVPEMFLPMATKMMQGLSVTEIVLNNLEDSYIILRFDENDDLVSYKVQDDKEELLDWMEFIANVKVDL